MIDRKLLNELLDLDNRKKLYDNIMKNLKSHSIPRRIHYVELETPEGKIPVLIIAKSLNPDDVKYAKIFVGAQHNEYNGLFGILEFLQMIKRAIIPLNDILREDQILIFAPLMNPYGFTHPSIDNKSGYYLKSGVNLNRYWRKVFAPEYTSERDNLNLNLIPEHAITFRKLIEKYWVRENIKIYILDFHETSLLERFLEEITSNLIEKSITYKFFHWLQEGIVYNVIKLYKIPISRKSLFYKCTPSADHTHINLTIRQLERVTEKLQEYILLNHGKLAFYFCYSGRSKSYCERLAKKVYGEMREILWETYFPAFNHNFTDHGCFVNMNDSIIRRGVYSMELESEKLFFNIFDEIDKSRKDKDYSDKKVQKLNKSIQLVAESIKAMIKLF